MPSTRGMGPEKWFLTPLPGELAEGLIPGGDLQELVHRNRQRTEGLRPADSCHAGLHGDSFHRRRGIRWRYRSSPTPPAPTRGRGKEEQHHTEQRGH
jgi:hypothetical protein